MEKKYYLQENGQVSEPYSLDDLRTKIIEANTLVCIKFGDWKYAKDIPDLEDLLEWQPPIPTLEGEIPKSPQIVIANNNREHLRSTKAITIVSGSILIAAFFMPWITAFVSLNAWDIVFGSAGEFINSSIRYVLVLIPISGILIIYNTVEMNAFTMKFKAILSILPLLTFIFVGIIIINRINADLSDLIKNDLGEITNLFGIGFWLTLICSVFLPYLGLHSSDKNEIRERKKVLLKVVIILGELLIPIYFLIRYLPIIIAFASSLFGLLLLIVVIPILIFGVIKLNKYLFSKL